MKVRGWLMIGPPETAHGLPPAATAGVATGEVPPASQHEPGVWIMWQPSPTHPPVVLVCIDVLL